MLSLKQNKPATDANLSDEEAAQRQLSAQNALAREVSEPAVIQAASDDQLQRPPSIISLPQQALAADMDKDNAKATAIAKQHSSIAKRFSFLTTLRRGQTLAEVDTHAAVLHGVPEAHAEQAEAEATSNVARAAAVALPAVVRSASLHSNAERLAANPIELPPMFEYGSDADEAGGVQEHGEQSRHAAPAAVSSQVIN